MWEEYGQNSASKITYSAPLNRFYLGLQTVLLLFEGLLAANELRSFGSARMPPPIALLNCEYKPEMKIFWVE